MQSLQDDKRLRGVNDIAITIDNNYIQHASVMLASLMKHNNRSMRVHCIFFELSEENISRLKKQFSGTTILLEFIPFKLSDTNNLPVKFGDHVTVTAYIRLWLPKILPYLDRVLFLDCDMVIDGNISLLLDLDIYPYGLAAVKTPTISTEKKTALGIPAERDYFNSGVLIMDLKYFRHHNLSSELVDFITRYPEKCEYWDQDALNAIFKGNFFQLDYAYNMTSILFDDRLLTHPSFTTQLSKPIIVHFTGGGALCKPWFFANNHPLKNLYYESLQNTPFKNYVPPDQPNQRSLSSFLKATKAFVNRISNGRD
jgi:lipopolysaccharide biosynthesis glycosyltransferase